MQRFYALISTALLTAFIALVALKFDSKIFEQESVTIEEIDLEDIEGDETEEIQFQLKSFNRFSKEALSQSIDPKILVDYRFAIKSNFQKVSSPPPKA
jgi:hypothetical protein